MRENPKVRLAILFIGGGLCVGAWVFLITYLLDDRPEQLTADVKQPQEESAQDIPKGLQDIPTSKEHIVSPVKDIFQSPTQPVEYSPIQVLVPPHVAQEQLQILRKSIYKDRQVLANIQSPKTRNAYEDLIKQELNDPSFDLILTPSIRLDSFSDWGLTIDFKQPITPLFHESLSPLIENKTTTFIPFSLDPYITLIQSNVNLPRHITIGHIQDVVRKANVPKYLPFMINDVWIEANIYPGYSDLILRFITDAAIQGHTYALQYLLHNENLHQGSIVTQVQKYIKTNKQCASFLNICLFANKHSGLIFGKLSDIEILEQHFDSNALEEQYIIKNLPVGKKSYPYVAWGRIIQKDSKHLLEVGERIKGYLELGDSTTLDIWKHSFSAFTTTYNQQRIQTRYHNILTYPSSIQVIKGSINDMDNMMKDTFFPLVLDDNYDINIFIDGQRK